MVGRREEVGAVRLDAEARLAHVAPVLPLGGEVDPEPDILRHINRSWMGNQRIRTLPTLSVDEERPDRGDEKERPYPAGGDGTDNLRLLPLGATKGCVNNPLSVHV